MATQQTHAVEERIIQLLQHLGIKRAHFVGCLPRDVAGLVTSHPDVVSSLTLVCPWGMNVDALRPISSRVLVITGDQGQAAEEVHGALASLPGTKLINLRDYFSPLWADVIADRVQEVGAAMTGFLSSIESQQTLQEMAFSEGEGEIANISYSIRGSGPPLVLK